MKVLLTGARGQLGAALAAKPPDSVELFAFDHGALDITARSAVREVVARIGPDLIINAAAYTAVDRAEEEKALAFRINGDGPGHLAEAAAEQGARLIHVSTDYVFDGTKSSPYRPDDPPNPLGVYGASKLAGEQAVTERSGGQALIVRTAWVYAARGRNFVNTMLRLLREKPEVRVVNDQFGTPTFAGGLAQALWKFAALPDASGIWHWTDAGETNWYEVAVEIRRGLEAGGVRGLAEVLAIPTSEYPTPARRPAYGVLDKSETWARIGPGVAWDVPLRQLVQDAAPPGRS